MSNRRQLLKDLHRLSRPRYLRNLASIDYADKLTTDELEFLLKFSNDFHRGAGTSRDKREHSVEAKAPLVFLDDSTCTITPPSSFVDPEQALLIKERLQRPRAGRALA